VDQPRTVALIGGGIMSATLGTFLQRLEPDWRITIHERLDDVAQESSSAWSNAGTGHAGYCELNYVSERADGGVDISKAVEIAEQFEVSRRFWAALARDGVLPELDAFLHPVPHLSLVRGARHVEFLRRRFEAMRDHPRFAGIEFSDDPAVIAEWAPLVVGGVGRRDAMPRAGRNDTRSTRSAPEPIAATRILGGADVDFGALTRRLIAGLVERGAELRTGAEVAAIRRRPDGGWTLRLRAGGTAAADFVFVGAGGGALRLLQSSGIPEVRGIAGFPIAGVFLRTSDPELVARHRAKVYGTVPPGAPRMSVPHLDTRIVAGEASLMFGPYMGFATRALRHGRAFDWLGTVRPHNLPVLLGAAARNLGLLRYLVQQVLASRRAQDRVLTGFAPGADPARFERVRAGHRVQIMRRDPSGRAELVFGNAVVAAADGSIAGLLGASPGASSAPAVIRDLLARCFPARIAGWAPGLQELGAP